ncbi:antitoxin Xre/MbcA/ParS toxin-binding domain-containing protein [Bosea sp. NPDC055353]
MMTYDRAFRSKSPAERAGVSGPGLRTFANLAALWHLTEVEAACAIGAPSRAPYCEWVEAARDHKDLILEMDVLLHISAILGIYASLRTLYGSDIEVLGWLRSRNLGNPFGGRPPLDLILGGDFEEQMQLRSYLAAICAGN